MRAKGQGPARHEALWAAAGRCPPWAVPRGRRLPDSSRRVCLLGCSAGADSLLPPTLPGPCSRTPLLPAQPRRWLAYNEASSAGGVSCCASLSLLGSRLHALPTMLRSSCLPPASAAPSAMPDLRGARRHAGLCLRLCAGIHVWGRGPPRAPQPDHSRHPAVGRAAVAAGERGVRRREQEREPGWALPRGNACWRELVCAAWRRMQRGRPGQLRSRAPAPVPGRLPASTRLPTVPPAHLPQVPIGLFLANGLGLFTAVGKEDERNF